jgi:CubicO group peptidase (beta-lactamase class C family)
MEREADLGEVLKDACEAHGVPGAVVGVLVDGEVVAAAHGVQNAERSTPMTTDTHVQVASITKTFTSAAVMLLVEGGLVSLDDPVGRHLPDFEALTGLDGGITVEQLLSHQDGFDGDHLFVTGRQEVAALADARRLFEPGTAFSYNNAAFSLAGEVVAAAGGVPFDRFVRQRLLKPMRSWSAGFTADHVITYPVASPHWVFEGEAHVIRGGGWQPLWQLEALDWAAGGLIATCEQLLEWGRFQWTGSDAEGTRLLSDESLARLHTPVVAGEPLDDVALDWYVRSVDGATTIGHGGVTPGYISDLLVVPEREAVVVCLTNATNGGLVNHEVRRWALEHLVGLVETDPVPDPSIDVDVTALTGTYEHSFCLLDVAVGTDGDTAKVTPRENPEAQGWQPPLEPEVTCRFLSETDAISVDDRPGAPRVLRFGPTGPDGHAEWLQWGGRLAPRLP